MNYCSCYCHFGKLLDPWYVCICVCVCVCVCTYVRMYVFLLFCLSYVFFSATFLCFFPSPSDPSHTTVFFFLPINLFLCFSSFSALFLFFFPLLFFLILLAPLLSIRSTFFLCWSITSCSPLTSKHFFSDDSLPCFPCHEVI